MLKNKKITLVISILFAVALWAYVVGEVNPVTTKTFTDIPINVLNEDVLEARGLALNLEDKLKTEITVEGTRAAVKGLRESKISAAIDVSECGKGKHTLDVDVKVPSDLKIKNVKDQEIDVNVESLISETRPVRVALEGKTDTGEEVGEIHIDPQTVGVTGPESLVEKVDHINAVIRADELKYKYESYEVRGIPVTAQGDEVGGVTTSVKKIIVSASLLYSREVTLKVNTVGSVSENYDVENIKIPDTVMIKGPKRIIDNINSITTEDVDLSGVTKTKSIPIKPILPENVELAELSKNLKVEIIIGKNLKGSVQASAEDIKFSGLREGFTVAAETDRIKIFVTGSASVMKDLDVSDFNITSDLSDLDAGMHQAAVYVDSGKGFKSISWNPKKIKVKIELL